MSRRVLLARGLLLAGLLPGLGGCFWFDENNQTQLVGGYFLVSTAEGQQYVYCQEPDASMTEPLLADVDGYDLTAGYLVLRQARRYYLYPAVAATAQAARSSRLGPLTEAACQQQLRQLTGDSLRLTRIDL